MIQWYTRDMQHNVAIQHNDINDNCLVSNKMIESSALCIYYHSLYNRLHCGLVGIDCIVSVIQYSESYPAKFQFIVNKKLN